MGKEGRGRTCPTETGRELLPAFVYICVKQATIVLRIDKNS